jgi:uncharacterized membrane protein
MSTKSDQEKSMFIIAYEGKDTADEVYDTLRVLEKHDQIDIKTAATVHRKNNGKFKLKHRRRVTVWKGTVGGGVFGLLLAGTGAGLLAGAVVGALIGSKRHGQRNEVKEFLDDKLGPDDSALAILVTDADWAAVDAAVEHFKGEVLSIRLSPEAHEQLEAIADSEGVSEAVAEEVESEAAA